MYIKRHGYLQFHVTRDQHLYLSILNYSVLNRVFFDFKIHKRFIADTLCTMLSLKTYNTMNKLSYLLNLFITLSILLLFLYFRVENIIVA